jgi:hypothetical protein
MFMQVTLHSLLGVVRNRRQLLVLEPWGARWPLHQGCMGDNSPAPPAMPHDPPHWRL